MKKHLFVMVFFITTKTITSESWKPWRGKNLTQQNLTQISNTINGELDISNNNIISIDADQFENVPELERLILNENKNFNFQANVMFLNKTELQSFNCDQCGITEIYDKTFQGLPDLTTLKLSQNWIKTIAKSAFSTNKNLKKIDLSSNQLQIINPATFNSAPTFSLNLDFNFNLKFESQHFFSNPNLSEISLQNCNFHKITVKTFENLTNLSTIKLNGNKIKTIESKSFQVNEKLNKLFLADNKLTILEVDLVENLKQLTVFCIDGNPFVPDTRNVKLQQFYVEHKFRNEYCTQNNSSYFEELLLEPVYISKGISDAYIGGYIAIIVIIQAVAVVLLVWYLIIMMKPYDLMGQIDYSSTILNDNDIYAIDRR